MKVAIKVFFYLSDTIFGTRRVIVRVRSARRPSETLSWSMFLARLEETLKSFHKPASRDAFSFFLQIDRVSSFNILHKINEEAEVPVDPMNFFWRETDESITRSKWQEIDM